jgi:hypothetical protein
MRKCTEFRKIPPNLAIFHCQNAAKSHGIPSTDRKIPYSAESRKTALGKADPVASGCEVKIDVLFCFLSCFCLDN